VEWRKNKGLVKVAHQVHVALSRNVLKRIIKSTGQTQPQAEKICACLYYSIAVAHQAMVAAAVQL